VLGRSFERCRDLLRIGQFEDAALEVERVASFVTRCDQRFGAAFLAGLLAGFLVDFPGAVFRRSAMVNSMQLQRKRL
jgi:hypothetical protein